MSARQKPPEPAQEPVMERREKSASEPEATFVRRLVSELRPMEGNPRVPRDHGFRALKDSLQRFGLYLDATCHDQPILVNTHPDAPDVIVGGQRRWEATQELGVPSIWTRPVFYDADQMRELAVRLNVEAGEWDWDLLAGYGSEAPLEQGFASNVDGIFREAGVLDMGAAPATRTGQGRPDEVTEAAAVDSSAYARECQERWRVRPGQVWQAGDHLVACRDAKGIADLVAMISVDSGHIVLTDPPYCSGGFQEAGRSAGTWGDIASDSLSTRGYSALMRAVLEAARPVAAYLFTDWRMWSTLTEVVEACGQPVRSMIVWDKGSPGLGGLWRTQHELVMFTSRRGAQRIKGLPAIGNVLSRPRTGNRFHYTEKPVDLLHAILANDEASPRGKSPVVDPFCGSGSSLLACQRLSRPCLAVDVEPVCVAVTLSRWEEEVGAGVCPPTLLQD